MKLHLKHIEYEIVDHCNLRCQNCTKFSYLKEKKNLSLAKIKEDFTKINNRFQLDEFTILGGEPLLHPQIIGIMLTAKKIFTNTQLKIISNGTTFLKKSPLFYNVLASTKILIEISKYDLNLDYNKMKALSRSIGINFRFIDKPVFTEFVNIEGTSNPENSFKACRDSFFCPNYRDEKLYTCGFAYSSKFLSDNNHISKKALDNGVSIYASNTELLSYLNKPVATCLYCKAEEDIQRPWKLLPKLS